MEKIKMISSTIDWNKYQISPLHLKWTLQEDDLNFSTSIGINLINNVITKRMKVVSI